MTRNLIEIHKLENHKIPYFNLNNNGLFVEQSENPANKMIDSC